MVEICRDGGTAKHNVPANPQRLAKRRSGSTITLARCTALHCMQCIHCYTCGMHRTASYPPRGISSSLLPRSTLLLRCSPCSRISPALRAHSTTIHIPPHAVISTTGRGTRAPPHRACSTMLCRSSTYYYDSVWDAPAGTSNITMALCITLSITPSVHAVLLSFLHPSHHYDRGDVLAGTSSSTYHAIR